MRELYSFIGNLECFLSFKRNVSALKLNGKSITINSLMETISKLPMYFHRSTNNFVSFLAIIFFCLIIFI